MSKRRKKHITVWVSDILSARDCQMANIPMPEVKHHVRAMVMYGRTQYLVHDYGDRGFSVMYMFDPRQRPMRNCGRRQRIVAAVRAHGSYPILLSTGAERDE